MVWQPLAPDGDDGQEPGKDGLRQDLWGVLILDAFFIEDQLADAGGTLCPTPPQGFQTFTKLPLFYEFLLVLVTARNLRWLYRVLIINNTARQKARALWQSGGQGDHDYWPVGVFEP